ncbi:50S ribosomal protein L17 [Candidatus Saccharibacteria bacterium]|nr:50S ribosomal protein L17 [Candidatus Saccharibacteria bacterium]
MHRHGFKGRKFGRKTDQRLALRRGLMCSLIEHQSITTTLARAKEIRREAEKLVTIAKHGGLANRRLLISRLGNMDTADFLMDKLAPQIKRDSGYLRIERAENRKGDNTEMATISFVDSIEIKEDK